MLDRSRSATARWWQITLSCVVAFFLFDAVGQLAATGRLVIRPASFIGWVVFALILTGVWWVAVGRKRIRP